MSATLPPLGQIKRTPRPDVALRERGWLAEYPAWWTHPTLTPAGRVTMAEAWARQTAADKARGLLQPGESGILAGTTERADAARASHTDGALGSTPDDTGAKHGR